MIYNKSEILKWQANSGINRFLQAWIKCFHICCHNVCTDRFWYQFLKWSNAQGDCDKRNSVPLISTFSEFSRTNLCLENQVNWCIATKKNGWCTVDLVIWLAMCSSSSSLYQPSVRVTVVVCLSVALLDNRHGSVLEYQWKQLFENDIFSIFAHCNFCSDLYSFFLEFACFLCPCFCPSTFHLLALLADCMSYIFIIND